MGERVKTKQRKLAKDLFCSGYTKEEILKILRVEKKVLSRWIKTKPLLPRKCSYCKSMSHERFYLKKAKGKSFCSKTCKDLYADVLGLNTICYFCGTKTTKALTLETVKDGVFCSKLCVRLYVEEEEREAERLYGEVSNPSERKRG